MVQRCCMLSASDRAPEPQGCHLCSPLQSAAAHRTHPEESEVVALVWRRVTAEPGGADAEQLADAIIEVEGGMHCTLSLPCSAC